MEIMFVVLIGVGLVGLGILVLFLVMRTFTVNEVTQRLNEFVVLQPTQNIAAPTESRLQRSDLSGPFRTRILQPFIHQVGSIFGRFTPTRSIDSLEHRLTIADRPYGLGPREFYGFRIIAMILGGLFAILSLSTLKIQ